MFGLSGTVTLLGAGALCCGPALADAPGSATVYRWVDSQGVVHYSDRPQPSAERLRIPPAQTFHDLPAAVRRARGQRSEPSRPAGLHGDETHDGRDQALKH